jgi:hypothetical protein
MSAEKLMYTHRYMAMGSPESMRAILDAFEAVGAKLNMFRVARTLDQSLRL